MTHDGAERFVPELARSDLIEAEHQARYRLTLPFVAGKVVLDAGCGVGWGSELLHAAGAGLVIGIDRDRGAVRDARARSASSTFLRADLAALPVADAAIDVVVCLEALEHTADAGATLDELVRVLRPDGLLFVSSPNPAVYPAGNPFHVEELAPAKLLAEVSARLAHVALYRQHLLVASTLCADAELPPGAGALGIDSWLVRRLERGHDPYAVAVGSGSALPRMRGVQALTTSHQLDNLDTLARALAEERARIHADHERIVQERQLLLDQRAACRAQLEELGVALRAAEQRLSEGDTTQRRLSAELERITALAARTSVERDRFAATLVRVEQALARERLAVGAAAEANRREVERSQEAARHAIERAAARAQLADIRRASWQITALLRRMGRRLARR